MTGTGWLSGLPILLALLALGLVAYIVGAGILAWRRRLRTVTNAQLQIERRVELLEGALDDLTAQVASTGNQTLIIANRFGHVVSVEGEFQRLFGYDPAEVIGHALIDLMPERYHARHLEAYGRSGDAHLNRFVQVHGLHKDGHEFDIQVRLGSFPFQQQRMFYGLITTPPVPIEPDSVLR